MKPGVLLVFILLHGFSARAAPGDTSFDFLNLGFGARQTAMGQAGTAVADDLAGSYLNPAGLSQLPRHEANFLYSSQFADISYQQLGYAWPTVRYGSFAASLFSLDYGRISGFDNSGTKTSDVSAWDRMLSLGYGKAIARNVSAGANLHYFREKLGQDTAQAAALDLGVLVRPWEKGLLSNLRAGLALKNMGMDAKFDQKREALPFTAQAGLAYTALQDSFVSALDVVKARDESVGVRLGEELWVKDAVALRAGFNSGYGIGSGFSFGVGVKFLDFQLDYSFVSYSSLGSMNKVGLTYRFGSVSEVYYSRGVREMNEGRYAEAILEFDKALALDPANKKALVRMREAHKKLKEKLSEREE